MKRFSLYGFQIILALMVLLFAGCSFPISKEAEKKFNARTGPFSVTVYPIRIINGPEMDYDAELAEQVIAFLQEEYSAKAVPSAIAAEFPVQWHRDQSKMLKESAESFAAHIRGIDIETDYALMAEIIGNRSRGKVGAVHFYLTDKDGLFASVGLNNSHWEEYKAIMPTNRNEGIEVLELMLKRAWTED